MSPREWVMVVAATILEAVFVVFVVWGLA